jgi:YVTN family beta-propeller protein
MKQPLQITGKARLAGYCVNALVAVPAVADPPKCKLANPARVLGAASVLAIVSLIATSVAHAEPFAYVTNVVDNNVSVIDTASNAVIATVAVGAGPVGVAITPDGAFAYVANLFSDNVSVIDIASNTVIATVTGVGIGPNNVAITPDGAFAYVTDGGSSNVRVIDTASNAVTATVAVDGSASDVAITPDGAFAYVANGRSDNVSVIDTASNAVTATVTVGDFPWGVAITPEPLAIEVRIDIKPGSNKNPINLRSKGNIAVAILSTGKFDATQVNWETVTFGPDEATEIHQRSHLKDVDKDGDLDFLLHFNIRETGIECGDKTATLTGETFNGEAFTGSDKITVKCH